MRQKAAVVAVVITAVLAVGVAAWQITYLQSVGQIARRGEADLALAADRLTAKLRRYQEMAVLMVDHPVLKALTTPGGDVAAARKLLLTAADKTAALELAYSDTTGRVLATSDLNAQARSLAGQAHFERASYGALGLARSVDGQGLRAFHYAAPDFGPDGRVQGVLAVSIDMALLEADWSGGPAAIYFTDEGGRVFITNRSELLFRKRNPGEAGLISPDTPLATASLRHVSGYDVWRLDWGPYLPRRALHLTRPLPVIGMEAEALIDLAPAQRLAWLQALVLMVVLLFFAALFLQAFERRRALAQANEALEGRVQVRTAELTDANLALRREVREREEAERALRKAQADLVQAGKLSALGQMSAGISHELNQPLMAIRQFAENGARFLESGRIDRAGDNLSRIADLATRAARIIKNLRAFARNESEAMGRVDLVQAITTAVELTEARLSHDGVTLDWVAPEVAIPVLGGEVRLGQVFVNLINNAADAMAGQPGARHIAIAIRQGDPLTVTVADTGPGIADPERVFEPFYSTKEVGDAEGMGLGLSISYGLVQSFGGNIRGANSGEGAVFTVELEPWRESEAA